MVYGQYEAALLFSDRHKAGARKMENRWSLIAKPTLKTMQRKPTSIRQQMSDTTQTEMLERGLTLRQYEEFARLQNGVLAQFTTQREILFAGQPFQAPESYLRNAELYEEGQTGNYNMLDGRLNNEPPVRPDLTGGQTDEEIRELVPEAKPSLMDRLKADKPEHEARQMIPPVPERER